MLRYKMMVLLSGLVLLAWLPPVSAGDQAPAPFEDAAIKRVQYPSWFKDSFLDLPDDAAQAEADGKQGLFLFFTTQGCSYCYLFIEEVLGDTTLSSRLREHFDSIGLEIFSDSEITAFDGDSMPVKDFALKQGVEFAPTLLFIDAEGTPLLRLTGYYGPERFAQVLDYLTTDSGQGLSWRDYLAQQTKQVVKSRKPLLADTLFAEPPYALDRTRVDAERPLLVLFEAAGCARCERFHDEVLADARTRERLTGFDVVRLDAEDAETPVLTPAGQRTTPADWYRSFGFTQLPALAFFSEGGEQVLETDALVLRSRMNNAIGFVTDRAYERGWNYQRYARTEGLKKLSEQGR
jgi:thioredoxin-related protein